MTKEDLLKHARDCVNQQPAITDAELRAELESHYIESIQHDRDVRALLVTLGLPIVGAVANPLDWLHGGARILKGAAKIVASKKIDGQSVADIVEGVIIIIRKNGSQGDQKKK